MSEDNVRSHLAALFDASTAVADGIASRFGLGRVRRIELLEGVGRRNALIETDEGPWILRAGVDPSTLASRCHHLSKPVDLLRSERFFAGEIRHTTRLAAPWPYRIDDQEDLLEAPYAMMPKLGGRTVSWKERLDWATIGGAMAEAALELHRSAWPAAGVWHPATGGIAPSNRRPASMLRDHLAYLFDLRARSFEQLDDVSRRWIEDLVAALEDLPDPTQVSLVHGDLLITNVCLVETGSSWSVSGVFDLEEARVGDPEEDLAGLWWPCWNGREDYVLGFLRRYGQERPVSPRLHTLLAVRLLEHWEFLHRNGFARGTPRTFVEYAKPRCEALERVIERAQ